MYQKLFLAMVIALTSTMALQAQSGSRSYGGQTGSGNKGQAGSGSNSKQQARLLAKEHAKFAREFVRSNLRGVKLNKDQKKLLSELVGERYAEVQGLDGQIARAIPATSARDLQKAYKKALKKGESNSEAMASSMEMVGISEMVQKEILTLNDSREEIIFEIRDEMKKVLDEEQLKKLAMMEKKAMDKEKAKDGGKEMDKEKEMSKESKDMKTGDETKKIS